MIGYKIFRKGLIDNGIKYELGEHVTLYDDPSIYKTGFKLYSTIVDGMWYWKQSAYKYYDYEIALIETIGKVVEEGGCACRPTVFATNEFIVKEVFSAELADTLLQKEQCAYNLIELSYKKVNDIESKSDLYDKISKLERTLWEQEKVLREKDSETINSLVKELAAYDNKQALVDFVSELNKAGSYFDIMDLYCPCCGKLLGEDDFKRSEFGKRYSYESVDISYWVCGNCEFSFNILDEGSNRWSDKPCREATLLNEAKKHKEVYEEIVKTTKEYKDKLDELTEAYLG